MFSISFEYFGALRHARTSHNHRSNEEEIAIHALRWCVIPLMEEEKVREPNVSSSVKDGEFHLLLADVYEDDISSYRRREAAWISGAVHAVIIHLLILAPKVDWNSAPLVPMMRKGRRLPILNFLPDQLKLKTPPKTDRISDANRIAQTRTPVSSKEALRNCWMHASRQTQNAASRAGPATGEVTPQQQPAPSRAPARSRTAARANRQA